jgi:hypothetical protein
MARRPPTRIDGQAPEGLRAAEPRPTPARKVRPTEPPRPPAAGSLADWLARLRRRAPAELWVGAGCVVVLLVMLFAGLGGGPETGRGAVEQASAPGEGAVVAVVQVPASDHRSVREICDDEGVPAALCVKSSDCAPSPPPSATGPRTVRLFLRARPGEGCG